MTSNWQWDGIWRNDASKHGVNFSRGLLKSRELKAKSLGLSIAHREASPK